MISSASKDNLVYTPVKNADNKSTPLSIPSIPWVYYGIAVILAVPGFTESSLLRMAVLGPFSIVLFIFLFTAFLSPLPAMMALIVYIPYSKAISGNFGGAITGFNFTTALMLIIVLGMYLQSQKIQKDEPLPLEKTFRNLVFFFCILGTISVVHSVMVCLDCTFFSMLVYFKRWIEPFLVFFLFSHLVKKQEDGKKIICLMAGSLVIVGIGSIWEVHVLKEQSHWLRFRGLADQANNMGAFYSDYIFLILGFLMMKGIGSFKKTLIVLGAYGFLMGLLATESRGDLLALVGGILLFLFLRNRLMFFAFVISFAFLMANIQYLPKGLRARLEKTVVVQKDPYGLGNSQHLDPSAQTRLAIWKGARKMIYSHPLLGVGLGMFPENIYRYVPHNSDTSHLALHRRDGHNAYLMIGAEMGIPALLLMITMIVFMLRVAIRSYRASPDPFWKIVSISLICVVISLIVTNMFGSRFVTLLLAGYIWTIVAILLKVPKWAKEDYAEGSS
ncbi:MAG: O-antigen ligase family protein [Leptospirales bacterium]